MPFLSRSLRLALSLSVTAACASHVGPEGSPDASPDAVAVDSRVTLDATVLDTSTPRDVASDAPSAPCTAMRVTFPICGAACDGPGRWFWNGSRCESDGCHTCEGVDCSATYPTLDACERGHALCPATICRATGGHWMPVGPFSECGDFVCGRPNDLDCFVPFAGCDCGPGRTYREGVGCETDPACTRQDLCRATGGALEMGCPFHCGRSLECPALGLHCNCGPAMNFDDTLGCVPSADCAPSDAALCVSTGGQWDSICCPSHCGMACPEPCTNPACRCRPDQVWIDGRGCVVSEECARGTSLQWCDANSPCAPGLACCGGVCTGACCGPSCDANGCPMR